MNIKSVLILVLVMAAGPHLLAQTPGGAAKPAAKPAPAAGAADGQIPKMKVAIIDVLAFRERVGELKAKYDKLQSEFGPKYQQLQSMETKLSAQEKTLSENKNLTPQQASKLNDEFEQGKKEYQRTLEDSQVQARKREQDETEAIYDKLSKFLDQYCAKQGITHVFDARRLQETGIVVYAAPAANITEEFIKEYNKAFPSPTAASAKP
ncbi:MAG TPA: OmpH family outer membrane protein [Blastocatellia bacterium]|nr:OmpH family outer membrane protein [Blastocatellia bacterium]